MLKKLGETDRMRKRSKRFILFHGDRGFQYTSRAFHAKLEAVGMQQSMSRVTKCIDNGPMEGFWGILKRERYYGKIPRLPAGSITKCQPAFIRLAKKFNFFNCPLDWERFTVNAIAPLECNGGGIFNCGHREKIMVKL